MSLELEVFQPEVFVKWKVGEVPSNTTVVINFTTVVFDGTSPTFYQMSLLSRESQQYIFNSKISSAQIHVTFSLSSTSINFRG